jgi:DNA ligase D-like protein (predicted 3'-phosphoesterase)
MSLKTYKKKRSFNQTPEPTGGKSSADKLVFVIQKHAASHLHYDFRLEMKGVLKSWAVPKGPSMNPADKRLAMLVEDHPFDYKDFEGTIPEGSYGAGTVIVWDQGTYEPLEKAATKTAQEKVLLKGFHASSLKIKMHGKKLKGEFALVRTHGRGENSWLLIKHRDEYATDEDITKKDKSVVTGKRLEVEKSSKNPEEKTETESRQQEPKPATKDLINKAEEAEKNCDLEHAANLYQKTIKKEPENEYAYDRLMIIYRKLKKYKEELSIINQGIKHFQGYHEKKMKEAVGKNSKIKQLSTALMKSTGLIDKKGRSLYEPEPVGKWKKRKVVVEKKLK